MIIFVIPGVDIASTGIVEDCGKQRLRRMRINYQSPSGTTWPLSLRLVASVSQTTVSCRHYIGDMQTPRSGFRMGRLDHVHIRVPDRAVAARWYAEHLGFEPVVATTSGRRGSRVARSRSRPMAERTTLELFEATESHPMILEQNGVAFSVDVDRFMSFARSLPCGIDNQRGEPLVLADLVDFDLCWALDLVDPWRNQYELNCYDYDRVRAELVEADDVKADRYWPR